MRKLISLFALTIMFTLSVMAQPVTNSTPVNSEPVIYSEFFPVFDSNSSVHLTIINIIPDSTAGRVESIPVVAHDTIPGYHNYMAIANNGWKFDHWEIISPYDTSNIGDSIPMIMMDTTYSFTDMLGDDLDEEFWGDWIGIPDFMDEYFGSPIIITAHFVADSNDSTTSIRIIKDKKAFMIYPNPVMDVFTIFGEVHMVTVTDMSGKIIISTNTRVINLVNYPNGVYFVRIMDAAGNIGVSKVIKQ